MTKLNGIILYAALCFFATKGFAFNSVASTASDSPPSIGTIHFAPDRSAITLDAARILGPWVRYLIEHEDVRLKIVGHVENSAGTREMALPFSDKLALAAKAYLVRNHIAENRIDTIGMGKERPVCKAESKACDLENRRVELQIVSTGR